MTKFLTRSPHNWRASDRKCGGRIVTLLLIPCMIADPVFSTLSSLDVLNGSSVPFNQQALSPFAEFSNILTEPYFAVRHRVSRLIPLLLAGAGLAFSQAQIPAVDPTSLSAQQEEMFLKRKAIIAIGDLGDPSAAGSLRQMLNSDGDNLAEIVEALIKLSKGRPLPELIDAMHDPDPRVSAYVIFSMFPQWEYITTNLSPQQRSDLLRQTFETALVTDEDWILTSFYYLPLASEEPWLEDFILRSALGSPASFIAISEIIFEHIDDYSLTIQEGTRKALLALVPLLEQGQLDPASSLRLARYLWTSEVDRARFPELSDLIPKAMQAALNDGDFETVLGQSWNWGDEPWAAPYIAQALALYAGSDLFTALNFAKTYGPSYVQKLLDPFQQEGDYERILDAAAILEGQSSAVPYLEWALDQAVEKEGVSFALDPDNGWLKKYIPILSDLEPILTDLSLSIPARIDGLIHLKRQPAYKSNRLLELLMLADTSNLLKNILFYYRYDFSDAKRVESLAQANAQTLYTLLTYTDSKLSPPVAGDLLKRLRGQINKERIDWSDFYSLHGDYRFWVLINHVNRLREATQDLSERKDLQQLLQTLRNVAASLRRAGLPLPAVWAGGPQTPIRLALASVGEEPDLAFNSSKGFNRIESRLEQVRYRNVAFAHNGDPIPTAVPTKPNGKGPTDTDGSMLRSGWPAGVLALVMIVWRFPAVPAFHPTLMNALLKIALSLAISLGGAEIVSRLIRKAKETGDSNSITGIGPAMMAMWGISAFLLGKARNDLVSFGISLEASLVLLLATCVYMALAIWTTAFVSAAGVSWKDLPLWYRRTVLTLNVITLIALPVCWFYAIWTHGNANTKLLQPLTTGVSAMSLVPMCVLQTMKRESFRSNACVLRAA